MRKYYATLSNIGGEIGTLADETIEGLREQIRKEWLPILDEGDAIKIVTE